MELADGASKDRSLGRAGGTEPTEYNRGMVPRKFSAAELVLLDVVEGIRRWELWVAMGVQGVKRRYRRSILGPLWLTLSLTILVAALSLLYGQLLNIPLDR